MKGDQGVELFLIHLFCFLLFGKKKGTRKKEGDQVVKFFLTQEEGGRGIESHTTQTTTDR